MNIYENCPVIENNDFLIRLIDQKDADNLLMVYSDKNALPYFNSDNCNGSNFYCKTKEDIGNAIKFWLIEYYENKAFVRFSIVDKKDEKAIGTIEMFRRESQDYYKDCGLMRVDVRSDYENTQSLYKILSLVVEPFYDWFECSAIATKAPLYAVDRIEALEKMNFQKSPEPMVGKNMIYGDYWIRSK